MGMSFAVWVSGLHDNPFDGSEHSVQNCKRKPHGGARGKLRESPKLIGFIISEPWMSVQTFLVNHLTVVEIFSPISLWFAASAAVRATCAGVQASFTPWARAPPAVVCCLQISTWAIFLFLEEYLGLNVNPDGASKPAQKAAFRPETLFETYFELSQHLAFYETFAELKLQSAEILSALQSTSVFSGKV